MPEKPIDIRTVSPEEYWTVFETKWTSLLSYRYLGRVNSGLDTQRGTPRRWRCATTCATRSAASWSPRCASSSPEAGGMNDDEFVPNPVIASMQILDDARDVAEAAGHPRDGPAGPPDGLQPHPHRRRRRPRPGHRHLRGHGGERWAGPRAITRRSTTRPSPSRTRPTCRRCTRCSGATRRRRRVVAAARAEPRAGLARRRPAPRASARACSRWRPPRPRRRARRDRPAADRELPLHVRGPGQGRARSGPPAEAFVRP